MQFSTPACKSSFLLFLLVISGVPYSEGIIDSIFDIVRSGASFITDSSEVQHEYTEASRKEISPPSWLQPGYGFETSGPPCYCLLVFLPVCGNNEKLYANDCELKCASRTDLGLRISHYGLCEGNKTNADEKQ